jgi:hypothetical protein
LEILKKVKSLYPSFGYGLSASEKKELADAWLDFFKNENYEQIKTGLEYYTKSDNTWAKVPTAPALLSATREAKQNGLCPRG